jgi:peptidoglycan/LPS O-acetylase OafA/YrhL
VTTIRELATRTPADRRRDLDLLRAVAILAVVLGHWVIMTVEREPGGALTGFSALPDIAWAHPLTWAFQVMPVFFLVGGAAAAISWTRNRSRGGTAATWLLDRSARLFPPLTAFLLALVAGTVAAQWAGVPPDDVARAAALVTLPLWFLVVYLGVTALTPVTHRLHERHGLALTAVLVAGVAAGDVLRFATGEELAAAGSFAFGWLAVHQAGFAWQDGTLRLGPRRAVVLLCGAAAALVLLTGLGPYPVSMVTVPGAAVQNASPPTVALLALAAAQLGAVALVAPAARRWLTRPGPWRAVVALNAVVLTLFLWHLVAALVGAVALDALGVLPPSDPRTGAWWLGRVPWVAALAVVLTALVAVAGRVEARAPARRAAPPSRPEHPTALARTGPVAAAYAATVAGLLWLTVAGPGPHGPLVVPWGALALTLGAAAVLRTARRAAMR